jgi:hypothetical protein
MQVRSYAPTAIAHANAGLPVTANNTNTNIHRVGGLRVLAIVGSFPYGKHVDLVAPHLAFVEQCLYDSVVRCFSLIRWMRVPR